MGNCFAAPAKSASEIAPSDLAKSSPVVTLYGSPTSYLTSYLRFALLYKPISLNFVPSETLNIVFETPAILCDGEIVSGSPSRILQYMDARYPTPALANNWSKYNETTPLVAAVAVLQHRSMTWHVERMVRWGEDLAARGGRSRGDPVMGSPRMEVKKYSKSYSQLLEMMFEHAQMEERIVFPVLESADRGVCRAANEEHARDLPIMNGVKEDIKAIGVLEAGTSVYQEALHSLSTRIKTLQKHCKQHFEEEERELLPLMEAAELSKVQQEGLLERCLDAMPGTHSHLFRFFIEGLLPQEAILYLDMITRSPNKGRVSSIFRFLVE